MSVITMSHVNTKPESHQLCKCSSDDSLGSYFKYNLTKINVFQLCVTKQCANYQLLFFFFFFLVGGGRGLLTRPSTTDSVFKE